LSATDVTASPSVTTDEPDRMAAVIGGPVILHQYLVANPGNSTITELAMWSTAPPLTAWPGSMTPPCSTRWVHRCARRTSGRASRAGIAGSPVEFEPQVPPTSARSRVARVVVNVMPKAEILDPQGQAIVGALGRLGHAGVSDVRQGKRFELEVDDSVSDEQLAEIAESLLANTVIEDWSVVREPAGEVMSARVGVITFPGTLDDVDAARAVRRAGAEAVSLWHADADLKGWTPSWSPAASPTATTCGAAPSPSSHR
jgi:phosphoribosylformylglycinamidine synthase